MKTIRLELPIPPSVNECYGNRRTGQSGRGRYPTKKLTQWRKHARAIIALSGNKAATAPCIVHLIVPPKKGRFDIDNLIKPVIDILVQSSILVDDDATRLRGVVAMIDPEASTGMITVKVETVSEVTPVRKDGGLSKQSIPATKETPHRDVLKQIERKFGIKVDPSRVHLQ